MSSTPPRRYLLTDETADALAAGETLTLASVPTWQEQVRAVLPVALIVAAAPAVGILLAMAIAAAAKAIGGAL